MFREILDVIWEALVEDSLKMLPVILICYIIIELLEEKILNKYKASKLLNSPFAPVVSAGFGLIPQCGFSVVATDLFSKRVLTIGSLMAIYLATSDEALPLMLSDVNNYMNLILILAIKFVYAVVVGIILDLIFRKRNSENILIEQSSIDFEGAEHDHEIHGCCSHDLENDKVQNKFKHFFIHPLIHSLKIFAYILVINIIFGLLVYFVGENSIVNFMSSTGVFQPVLVAIVGLIPNCAASVIITEFFLNGGIALGSCIAGLCANSGIALIMLFKLNKNRKENFTIFTLLYILSISIGLIVNLFV